MNKVKRTGQFVDVIEMIEMLIVKVCSHLMKTYRTCLCLRIMFNDLEIQWNSRSPSTSLIFCIRRENHLMNHNFNLATLFCLMLKTFWVTLPSNITSLPISKNISPLIYAHLWSLFANPAIFLLGAAGECFANYDEDQDVYKSSKNWSVNHNL